MNRLQLILTVGFTAIISFVQYAQNNTLINEYRLNKDEIKTPPYNPNKINVHRPHKSNNYNWDENSSSWTFIDSSEYQYNAQGQKTIRLSKASSFTERSYYYYDNLFRFTLENRDIYDQASSTWKPANRHQMDYTIQGDVTLDQRSSYNNGGWEIWSGRKCVYQYDNNNRISERIEFAYIDQITGYRENLKLSDIVYDNNDNVVEKTISNWDGSQFVYYEKNIATYNPDNTIHILYTYSWNTTTNSWDNYLRNTYSYSANNSYICLVEYYAINAYQTAFRNGVEYDSFGNRTRYYIEQWDDVNNNWSGNITQDFEDTYTYNQNDYLTQETNRYIHESSLIYYTRKDYFDFTTFDSQLGIEESDPKSSVSVYPNPTGADCVVDLSNVNGEVISIQLSDLSGNQLSTINLPAEKTILLPTGALQSGIYIIKIQTNKGFISSKIIVR